jgi:hypothetical protein
MPLKKRLAFPMGGSTPDQQLDLQVVIAPLTGQNG